MSNIEIKMIPLQIACKLIGDTWCNHRDVGTCKSEAVTKRIAAEHKAAPKALDAQRADARTQIKLRVPGIPVPEGDLAVGRHGRLYHSNDKELREWRYEVMWRARKAMRQNRIPIHDGPVIVRVAFVLYRPKATPKRRETPWAIKKPDLDKLVRGVLDAMTSHVYVDDSQVVEVSACKRLAELDENPGATIRVEFL